MPRFPRSSVECEAGVWWLASSGFRAQLPDPSRLWLDRPSPLPGVLPPELPPRLTRRAPAPGSSRVRACAGHLPARALRRVWSTRSVRRRRSTKLKRPGPSFAASGVRARRSSGRKFPSRNCRCAGLDAGIHGRWRRNQVLNAVLYVGADRRIVRAGVDHMSRRNDEKDGWKDERGSEELRHVDTSRGARIAEQRLVPRQPHTRTTAARAGGILVSAWNTEAVVPHFAPLYATRTRKVKTDRRTPGCWRRRAGWGPPGRPTGRPMRCGMSGHGSPSAISWCGPGRGPSRRSARCSGSPAGRCPRGVRRIAAVESWPSSCSGGCAPTSPRCSPSCARCTSSSRPPMGGSPRRRKSPPAEEQERFPWA